MKSLKFEIEKRIEFKAFSSVRDKVVDKVEHGVWDVWNVVWEKVQDKVQDKIKRQLKW